MDATILRSLLLVTLAMAAVLLVRRPVRQSVGAGPAFTLWLLPPLMAILPWLPTLPAHWVLLPTIHLLPGDVTPTTAPTQAASISSWLWRAWLLGTALGLLRLVTHYVGLHRHNRRLPEPLAAALRDEMDGFDLRRLRLHPTGPAVLCAPRSLLLLPPDFMQRFNPSQRNLILRHELAHLRRGDALWSVLAELAAALLWFHPLMWLALSRFRLDQELACDERVLRHAPQDETSYAHILMHSVGSSPVPALVPWLAEPQLKERLTMIQRSHPGALRRRFGYTALAALMAGTVFMAQATVKHDVGNVQALPQETGIVAYPPPPYPESAIENKEEGTVMLLVLVGVDGKPITTTVEPTTKAAPELIQAARDWVMQHWRFSPALENGAPVQSYARVPVAFRLSSPAPTSSNGAPAAIPPPSPAPNSPSL